VSAWSLKLSAVCITLFMLVGSYDYAQGHLKNPTAPLQPPVADRPTATGAPAATASPAPTIGPLLRTRPGQRQPAITPGPRLTLAPGVQTATLAPITLTHTS
jgi:hypothetical protein